MKTWIGEDFEPQTLQIGWHLHHIFPFYLIFAEITPPKIIPKTF